VDFDQELVIMPRAHTTAELSRAVRNEWAMECRHVLLSNFLEKFVAG
jgi:hypothetical protein